MFLHRKSGCWFHYRTMPGRRWDTGIIESHDAVACYEGFECSRYCFILSHGVSFCLAVVINKFVESLSFAHFPAARRGSALSYLTPGHWRMAVRIAVCGFGGFFHIHGQFLTPVRKCKMLPWRAVKGLICRGMLKFSNTTDVFFRILIVPDPTTTAGYRNETVPASIFLILCRAPEGPITFRF